jgi:hypothetical protein
MPTVPTKLPVATSDGRAWARRVRVPEMWASLAIVAVWLTVLFDALFGPDFVTSSGAGTNTTTIPSAVIIALFAYLATRVIARYGFDRRREEE